MASAIEIIFEMVWHIIINTIQTTATIVGLFQKLLGALLPVSVAGPGGSVLAGAILLLVAYFCVKFVFKSGKEVVILLIIGIIIVVLLLVGKIFV